MKHISKVTVAKAQDSFLPQTTIFDVIIAAIGDKTTKDRSATS